MPPSTGPATSGAREGAEAQGANPKAVRLGPRGLLAMVGVFAALFVAGAGFGLQGLVLLVAITLLVAASIALAATTSAGRLEIWLVVVLPLCLFGLLAGPALWNAWAKSPLSQCRENLRLIGLALREYHDHHASFPPAYIADAAGRPKHSWRVLLLPFLGEGDRYDRYRFDEPWNGPHNRLLANPAPNVFRCPADPGSEPATTSYVAVVGPKTAWPGRQAASRGDFVEGSLALMVVEMAPSNIHWMEPRDLPSSGLESGVNVARGRGISSGHPGGAQVLLVDGTVKFLPDAAE